MIEAALCCLKAMKILSSRIDLLITITSVSENQHLSMIFLTFHNRIAKLDYDNKAKMTCVVERGQS